MEKSAELIIDLNRLGLEEVSLLQRTLRTDTHSLRILCIVDPQCISINLLGNNAVSRGLSDIAMLLLELHVGMCGRSLRLVVETALGLRFNPGLQEVLSNVASLLSHEGAAVVGLATLAARPAVRIV